MEESEKDFSEFCKLQADQNLRTIALVEARTLLQNNATPDDVVRTATKFYSFIKGDSNV